MHRTAPNVVHLTETLGHQFPRVDATADLYVGVTEDDVEHGVPRDHCNCAVAQAIKRAVGHPNAECVIYPSVAYVLMPCDRETRLANPGVDVKQRQLAWHRFRVGPELTREIERFDKTGKAAADGYRFTAPTHSQTLRYKRSNNASRADWPGRKIIAEPTPWRRSRAREFPK